MTKNLNKKGTSLVELIAVIIIMGIIAAIAIPVTVGIIGKQREKAAIADAQSVISALQTRSSSEVQNDYITVVADLALQKMQVTVGDAEITTPDAVDEESEALGLENFSGEGTVTYSMANGVKSIVFSEDVKIDGYTIKIAVDSSEKTGFKISAEK